MVYRTGDNTRTKILFSAIQLVETGGFAMVTNTNVAALAGVNKSTINYHFGTTAELCALIQTEALRVRNVQVIARMILDRNPLVEGWSVALRLEYVRQALACAKG